MAEYVIVNLSGELSDVERALFCTRIDKAYSDLRKQTTVIPEVLLQSHANERDSSVANDVVQKNTGDESKVIGCDPLYTFDRLILPEKTQKDLLNLIRLFEVKDKVFNQWNLRIVEPNPKVALNFYGPPGTGKTMAAHAIASRLGRKILAVSYADIESKYHGDGPKNVKNIFETAEKNNAVLFIDEADSLLSKRLTNVTQGSEQAINSMRSQLLICMELFSGIVIFSTNLVENYDKAFETRIRHIEFKLPDYDARKKIWRNHLPKELPLDSSVSLDKLANIEDVCGRDIRNAVVQAAIDAALDKRILTENDLEAQIQQIKDSRIKNTEASSAGRPLTVLEQKLISEKILAKKRRKKK